MSPRKAVFLDRDGTINIDHGFVRAIDQWQFTQDAPLALAQLKAAGFALVIVTNQSGIAAGLYGLKDMQRLHEHMKKLLAEAGVTIDAIAYCPHARGSACLCRKPGIGMIQQITRELGELDLSASWSIGDKLLDFEFGRQAGTKTALIRSKYWQENDLQAKPDIIIDSLAQAANYITSK